MQPLINLMGNFDALLDFKVEFTYLGSDKITTNEVEIRPSGINTQPIYKRQSSRFDKHHVIPAGTLTNGQSYRIKIRVLLHDSTWSVWSPEVEFICLKTPNVIFENLQEDKFVYNNDILFRAIFQQEQGDRVETYQFVLMDSKRIPIAKFPVRRTEAITPNLMQERITDLDKGRLYYIGVYITTTNGVQYFDKHEFIAHYVAPSTSGIIETKNDEETGLVLLQAYLQQNVGIQVTPYIVKDEDKANVAPVDYAYIGGEKIIIPEHRPLRYSRLGMAEASDFVVKLWCQLPKNGKFLEFMTENQNGIGISLYKRDDRVVLIKEFLNEDSNGIRSIHTSNVINGLGKQPFYLYVKMIEFRPHIYIEKVQN